jgi:hypothetical protein
MSVSPRTWLVTFMALIFMIGVSAGVIVDRTLLDDRPVGRRGGGPGGSGGQGDGGGQGGDRRSGPIGLYGPLGPPAERYVSDLARDLELSDAQRTAILAILDEQRPRVQQLQDDARAQFVEAQQALFDAIAAELTPEQVTAFQALTERQRDRGGRSGRGRGR